MGDFLDELARNARKLIQRGYYHTEAKTAKPRVSLKKTIQESRHAPIIAEIKRASPTHGVIRKDFHEKEIASAMVKGGAAGISVLAEPKYFRGSLHTLEKVCASIEIPVLMKDIIISPVQLEAASALGAEAVLLIEPIFERGYCEASLDEMIAEAHELGLEVLLEAHTEEEFISALNSNADLIGINNRDLRTMEAYLEVTKRILEKVDPKGKIVVSESGIQTPEDIRFLRRCGAKAFLIGSSIMSAEDVEKKVREFVNAL